MATITATATMRTIRLNTTALYASGIAVQGYLSSGALVGLMEFSGFGTTLNSSTIIKSITIEPTIGDYGIWSYGDRTITLYSSNYQSISGSYTGAQYRKSKLGDLVGNGQKTTGTASTYKGAQIFTLNSSTNSELFAALSTYLKGGNDTILLTNDETSVKYGYSYSANYLNFTACSITVEYDAGCVYIRDGSNTISTTLTLSDPAFYNNGAAGASSVVGVSEGLNRVARYSFNTPNANITNINLNFSSMWYGSGTQPTTYHFYIGTDPNSHLNAGASSSYTGVLYIDTSTYTAFSGSANITLLPNTTYYLFVFPDTTTFGWYHWEGTAEMTALAVEGWSTYVVYIDNGTSWDKYVPYIDNGTGWDICG